MVEDDNDNDDDIYNLSLVWVIFLIILGNKVVFMGCVLYKIKKEKKKKKKSVWY